MRIALVIAATLLLAACNTVSETASLPAEQPVIQHPSVTCVDLVPKTSLKSAGLVNIPQTSIDKLTGVLLDDRKAILEENNNLRKCK